MGQADGLGSGRGVRRLPSAYANSRVAPAAPPPRQAAGRDGALRPSRESEVIGPGWTQAVSADHSQRTPDRKVRQLQGFDQGLCRWQGGAHRGMVQVGWVGK